jgi:hypothetical protein
MLNHTTPTKFLVIAAVGDHSLHKEWLAGTPQFDVVLINYGEKELAPSSRVVRVVASKGQKFHLIKDFIDSNPEFLRCYKFVWLPDDDLSINADAINKMFVIAASHKLLLAQPSVKGHHSYDFTLKHSNDPVRYTQMVEIMAPLFSIDTLWRLKNTFKDSESGWGLDRVWPHLLGCPKAIGVIDAVSVVHTRPIGTLYGNRFSLTPSREAERVLWMHGLYGDSIAAILKRSWLRLKGKLKFVFYRLKVLMV